MTDVELSGLEVKPYIHSQKNCRPSASGYVMEAIDSTLILDLSHFDPNSKLTIITKRISGNGKVKINTIDYEVLSKESNHLEIERATHQLSFIRKNDCIGKIIIVSITISTKDVKTEINPSFLEPKKIPQQSANWKNILIKCGEVRGIKLLNDKIYASEGAFIQKANLIESLSTNPPNCFVKSDVIKFVYPCEITTISFNSGFDLPILTHKYKHFEDPPPLRSISNMQETNTNNILVSPTQIHKSNNVLYDSFEGGLNANFLSNVSEVISDQGRNNKGIILKRTGTFSIPMSILQPNMQYVVVINIKKVNGNGKIGVELTTTDGVSKSSIIILATERETESYLKLNTGSPPTPGNTYIIKIFRPAESTVGDVLLNKLMIINGITLANNDMPKHINQNATINRNSNDLIDKNELDPIRALSKKYSRTLTHNKTSISFNFTGEVSIKTRSGMNWFNKISPMCPKIKLVKDAKVLFGELGSLIPADKIWLKAFNNEISDKDNEVLKNAKMILSPSLQNTELLSKLYKDANIQLLEKTWPIIEQTPIKQLPKDYIILFHRNNKITKRIVAAYSHDLPLVIVGAIEAYSGNVIQLNEYITYDKILSVLLNAKCLIDIPEINDYNSGLLSLAFDSGLPTLTSNWFGLGKNNCKFIITKDKIDELNIPKLNDIKNGIDDVLKLNKENLNINHNEKLNKMLTILFG